jgi:ABC-type transport system substrate-binding protein
MAVESGNPWVGQVGSELTTQLETAGISVMTIPVAGSAGLAQLAAAGGYDLALVSRTASPYLTPTVGWYSDNLGALGTNGSSDWSHFDDPDVDQQFAIASQDLNPVTGDAVYGQIDDVLWDQMVALPLFELPALVANGVQLANITYNPTTSGLLWNVPVWTTLVPKVPNGT